MFRTALGPSLRSLRCSSSSRMAISAPSMLGKAQSAAHRYITQEARSKIQKAIEEKPVVLFMKGTPDAPMCGFSRAVVQVLDLHGVPPEKMQTYNVLADADLRNSIKEFSEWPTIPQIYVNAEFIGGCDILLGMHQSGELETLLENNEIIPKVAEESATAASSS